SLVAVLDLREVEGHDLARPAVAVVAGDRVVRDQAVGQLEREIGVELALAGLGELEDSLFPLAGEHLLEEHRRGAVYVLGDGNLAEVWGLRLTLRTVPDWAGDVAAAAELDAVDLDPAVGALVPLGQGLALDRLAVLQIRGHRQLLSWKKNPAR